MFIANSLWSFLPTFTAQTPDPHTPDIPSRRGGSRWYTETLKEAKIILGPKLQRLLERYEDLHGKQQISGILTDLLEAHLEKRDPLRKMVTSNHCVKKERPEKTPAACTTAESKKPTQSSPSRYISTATQDFLWKRSRGVCEWVDLKSGKRCSSRYRLQIDHYPIPFARGGPSTPENLRQVCAAHNARFAVESFGKEARDFKRSESLRN